MLRDEPIHAPESPWWTILGLKEDDGWYELYQAKDEHEAKKFLSLTFDSDAPELERYDDFAKLAPSIEHSIPRHAIGQHRAWLESNSPATADRRRVAAAPAVSAHSRARRRK